MDDLTVRTGRVIDGQFLTDAERDDEIKKAMKTGPALAPQPAADALEAQLQPPTLQPRLDRQLRKRRSTMSGCLITTTRRGSWRWFTPGHGPLGSLG